MTILFLPINFNDTKELMHELIDRLSIFYPSIYYDSYSIRIRPDIVILFRPSTLKYYKGMRPDYYWTNSYEVEEYFEYVNNSKRLQTFEDFIHVIEENLKHNSNLPERYRTCGRCVHNVEEDIIGSICHMCKRNPTDHRIDCFEEIMEEKDG